MSTESDPHDPDLPVSLVPRWLAAVVLAALLAAAGYTAWWVISLPVPTSEEVAPREAARSR